MRPDFAAERLPQLQCYLSSLELGRHPICNLVFDGFNQEPGNPYGWIVELITANVNVQLLEELGEEEKHFRRKLLEQVRAPLKG